MALSLSLFLDSSTAVDELVNQFVVLVDFFYAVKPLVVSEIHIAIAV